MGKTKSKQVRRTGNTLMEQGVNFTDDFEYNKKVLKNNMPSKKMRNQIAGYLVRTKRKEKESEPEILKKE